MIRLALLLLALAVPAFAAITEVNVASTPTSDPGTYPTSGTTDTISVAPPTGMSLNDYIVVLVCQRANGITFSNSTSGGQPWSSDTAVSAANRTCQFWRARFTGAWAADPAWTSTTANNNLTAYMMVFRGVHVTTAVDSAALGNSFTTSSGEVTITGGTTATNNALAIYCWSSIDNNAWTLPISTGLDQHSPGRIRNTGGSDFAVSCGWKIVVSAGASGDEMNDETDLGSADPGTWHWIALRESATTSTTTTTISTTTTTTAAPGGGRRRVY